MITLNKILVVNDSLDGMEQALGKAALIEHYTGAEVEAAEIIWDTIDEEPIAEAAKANLIEAFVAAERHGLENLLAPYRDRIAWSEARVLWDKRTDQAILDEVSRQHVDLLIKPSAKHTLTDYLHAPLDWRLIRECSCPVLISKTPTWSSGGRVLAAVDIADEDHAELSARVVGTARIAAEVLGAELHICCVYSDLGQSVNALQVAMDYEGIKEDMRQARESALAELMAKLEIDDAITHVVEGKPAATIADLAQELEVTLTVMGTAARKGLSKLVLGNTAEDTLVRLPGDVLTVRI